MIRRENTTVEDASDQNLSILTRRAEGISIEYEEMNRHHRFVQQDIDQRRGEITGRNDKEALLDLAHEQIMFDERRIEQLQRLYESRSRSIRRNQNKTTKN